MNILIFTNYIMAEVVYDGKLSIAAVATLVFMIVAICGGLAWSMYKAMTAAKDENEKQFPEDI